MGANPVTQKRIVQQALKHCLNDKAREVVREGHRGPVAREHSENDGGGTRFERGIYLHAATGFSVNLQLGEVMRNGESLVPVPNRMTRLDEYRRVFGKKSRTCSVKSTHPVSVSGWCATLGTARTTLPSRAVSSRDRR